MFLFYNVIWKDKVYCFYQKLGCTQTLQWVSVLWTEIEQEVPSNLQPVGVNRRRNYFLTCMHRLNLGVLASSWLCVPHALQNKSDRYMGHDADLHWSFCNLALGLGFPPDCSKCFGMPLDVILLCKYKLIDRKFWPLAVSQRLIAERDPGASCEQRIAKKLEEKKCRSSTPPGNGLQLD